MAVNMCRYRFDDEFIRLLKALTDLERSTKTLVIQKVVMNYLAENMDRLEQIYKQMQKMDLWV